jgi:catechol 2,3-dioxygenase-like lactoylglutathione lyase family enzyme
MITSGIDRVFISVKDMNESLTFYRDWVGMKVVAEQHLDPEAVQQLWKLRKGTKARAVFLQNEEQPTMLELIQFQPHSERTIRGGAKTWDYGIYDICFVVQDLDKTYKDLMEKGFAFISPPIFYSPDWVPFDVKESILIGPDEMPIAHAEIIPPLKPEMHNAYGQIFDSAQMVEDMDEAIRFYRDILGLTLVADNNWGGLVDELLRLPPDTDVRMVLFNKEGTEAPVVECIKFSLQGKSLASVARPPNRGIFMISFETDDLSGLIEEFNKKKVNVLSGPVEMEVAPHGMTRAVTVEGPSKVMIEFFETKK